MKATDVEVAFWNSALEATGTVAVGGVLLYVLIKGLLQATAGERANALVMILVVVATALFARDCVEAYGDARRNQDLGNSLQRHVVARQKRTVKTLRALQRMMWGTPLKRPGDFDVRVRALTELCNVALTNACGALAERDGPTFLYWLRSVSGDLRELRSDLDRWGVDTADYKLDEW